MNNDLAEWDDKEFAANSGNAKTAKKRQIAGDDDIERESRKKVHITINMSNSTCQNISINTGADDRDSDDESE